MKASCRVFDDSDVMSNTGAIPSASELLDSLWFQNPSPSFHGAASMVNFEQARGESRRRRASAGDCEEESCDGELDHPPEKKRRLTAEQVRFLEKSFEVENKLEPDRKSQLAKEAGLQPRQVAIWFQNRRARSKTKVLEREFDSLKSCYEKLKSDYDNLFSDNEKLRNEVNRLNRLNQKGNDPISPLDFAAKDPSSDNASNVVAGKTEEATNSTCSYSSGHVFEADHSDFSQDEDEFLVQRLCLPKLEEEYYDDLQPNSCNLGFPVQNQGTWLWQF